MTSRTLRQPNFQITPHDHTLIVAITDRAEALYQKLGVPFRRITCIMDLTAAHNTVPLNLTALLAADDSNFAHDVGGIACHIDRTTGDIKDGFYPRFAVSMH